MTWLPLLLAASTCAAQANLVRNGDFEASELKGWLPSKNVSLAATTDKVRSGKRAIKLTWHDVTQMPWGRGGNLCWAREIVTQGLKEDTRYRVKCSVMVEELNVAPEAKKWLAEQDPDKFDPATVTIGCFGGYWTSRMPWAAYDHTKLGTWQDLEFEFTTPFNLMRIRGQSGAQCFRLHFDVYPNQNCQMRSSGVMYIDSVCLEECPPRVGFTKTQTAVKIDGDLGDWWETNPAVITCDQTAGPDRAPNRSASGIFYTMWDDEWLYVAAKVIDDHITPGSDGIAVWLNGREHFVSSASRPEGCAAAVKAVEGLGSTTNMYRIVTQFGEEVRGRSGYVVELAIPAQSLGSRVRLGPTTAFTVAFEIRDADGQGAARHLYYPHNAKPGKPAQTAAAVFANEKGEIRGGEYPEHAITDAANPREPEKGPELAIKNVAARVVRGGRLGYTVAPYRRGDRSKVDAIVSWTTNWAASGYVRYGLNTSYGREAKADNGVGDRTGIAIRAILRDLEPNRKYHFQVVARGIQGERRQSDDSILDTTAREVEGIEHGRIPLTVAETANVARTRWPVTSGVPFPKGHLGSIEHLRLLDAKGREVPAQFAQTAEWNDGSVRWVLLDFQADVPARGSSQYILEYGSKVRRSPPGTSLRVADEAGRVVVDTGPMQFAVSKTNFTLLGEVRLGKRLAATGGRLSMVDGEGTAYLARKPNLVEVEELGPLRACIRAMGKYIADDGSPLFDYEVRIHAFAGKPFVRVVHNYVVQMEKGAPARQNEIKIRSMSIEVPLVTAAPPACRFGTGSDAPVEVKAGSGQVEARQAYESQATIAGKRFKRLPGWVAVGDALVAVEHFWQLYPKALAVGPSKSGATIRIDTMPAIAAAAYESEPNSPEDYVWGYLRGGRYRVRTGEGRSHQIFFTFGAGAAEVEPLAAAQTAPALMAVAEPEWYCDTKAAGHIHPRDLERFGAYETGIKRSLNRLLAGREKERFFDRRFGRYGLRNFGDNFGSDGMNWDNVEYDMEHCCLAQFMRSGDLQFFHVGREISLHNMHVDCLHHRDGWERLCHHTGDHSARAAGIGHTWCEGLWEYYYLTGDRHSAQKALGIGNDLARRCAYLCAAGQSGAGGARDFGWAVLGLMATYGATADPFYLNAAREIEEVAVRTQHPFRGGWIHRLSVGHCFHAPAHSGRVNFMQGIVLAGQVRFLQAVPDPDVERCLVRGAEGILYDEWVTGDRPGIPYTSCPFMPKGWRTTEALWFEPVAYAYQITKDITLAKRIAELLPKSGIGRGDVSSGGKGFAQCTRFVPNVMYYLTRLPESVMPPANTGIAGLKPQAYRLRKVLKNVEAYVDRKFVLYQYPTEFKGATLIATANDDKDEPSGLSFVAATHCTVHLLVDTRNEAIPTWMPAVGFRATGKHATIAMPDGTAAFQCSIYARGFSTGERVVLGAAHGMGFKGEPGNCMYVAIVRRR